MDNNHDNLASTFVLTTLREAQQPPAGVFYRCGRSGPETRLAMHRG